MPKLHSCIYPGRVRHRRFNGKGNDFTYKVFMMYLDLDEVDTVFAMSSLWSTTHRFAPAHFNASDFQIGEKPVNSATELKASVSQYLLQKTGKPFNGQVRLLSNIAFFGYSINPICNFYCFDGDKLEYIIAAVTNTPWGETQHYLHTVESDKTIFECVFEKTHHVSPFMHMNMQYHWRSSLPADTAQVHIENWEAASNNAQAPIQASSHVSAQSASKQKIFDATLALHRQEISSWALNKVLVQYPLMSVKVAISIYWQALKLWCKSYRFVSHPQKQISMLANAQKHSAQNNKG